MPTVPRQKRRRKLAAGAAAVLGAAMAPEAAAAVINVETALDSVAADSQCSLREAIDNANDDAATHADCEAGTGLDTIQFTLGLPATIVLTSQLTIADALTIDGPGQTGLTIDGNDTSRIFLIEDDDPLTAFDVVINDVTLTEGNAAGEITTYGGAIFSADNLTLTNVTITGSEADLGGAVYLSGGPAEPTLTVVDSTFSTNSASSGGAIASAYGGNLAISGSTLTGNTADCCGGAILQGRGDFTLTSSSVTDNDASYVGGIALYYADVIIITSATISGNQALGLLGDSGGLYIYNATGSVTIEDSVISGNEAALTAGGIRIVGGTETPVSIRDSEISGNTASYSAGGLYLYDTGTVTIERTKIINNIVANEDPDLGSYAGGIGIFDADVTIIESQISGNSAETGGGLYVGYGSYLYLVNSTVANNQATEGSGGGIIVNNSYAFIDVSTISGNTAANGAAGNIFLYAAQFYMGHSIVANGEAVAGPDLVTAGSSALINWSLIENTTGATFSGSDNITGEDPQLGPLQDNGGPTETMMPALTSPVIDAGSPEFPFPTNDQRGFPRPVGIVDLGAVEVNAGTLSLSSDAYSVNEGDGFLTITVNRTGGSDGAVSVDYATSSGTATADADFTTTTGTLNWTSGDADPKTFNIPITDDLIFEGNEQFTITLSNVVGATLGLSSSPIAIVDNDSMPTVSISNGGAAEGDSGNTPATFTVTLSNPTTQTVTVNFATAGVTATENTDFLANSGTITFDPLETSQTVDVQVVGDEVDEPDETFTVTLSNPNANATIADGTGDGTITDDEDPPVISISDGGATEGDAGNVAATFTVSLSGESSQTITVDFATAGVTATSDTDFLANSGTITFDPGETTQEVTVQVVGDELDEFDETFTVTLSNPNANGTIGDGTGEGTITDDDDPPAISISDGGAAEGDAGNTPAAFNVTLSAPSGKTITVNFSTSGVTATSGDDFLPNSGTVTFDPGDTSEPVTVQVVGDPTDEPDETFNVILDSPNANATVDDGIGLGTITDDDDPPAISISDGGVTEGDGGGVLAIFDVTLSNPSSETVTVNFAPAGVTATADTDFLANSGTVTFGPGQTLHQVAVQVVGDVTDEPDETFNVTLSSPSANASIGDGTAVGTIIDDDDPPTININDSGANEGDAGNTPATFFVTLSNPSSQTVTVGFATAGVTATSGDDFLANSGTVTFDPGVTSQPVTVQVVGDTIDESNETFNVVLSTPSASAAIGDGTGEGLIVDDEGVPTLAISDVTVVEGDAGNVAAIFDVTLSNPAAGTVTVDFDTVQLDATSGTDFLPDSGTITFDPLETTQQVTIQVAGDNLGEPDETFSVVLSNPNANATLGDSTGVGTIEDDDAPVISIDDGGATEGDAGNTPATFNVTLSNPSTESVTVDFATAGGTATSGDDFLPNSGTVIFAPLETSKPVTVQVAGDTLDEPNETFTVMLSNANANGTIGDASATGTITDDDAVVISISDGGAVEGDAGNTPATFTVTLSQASTQTITVDFATVGVSATSGTDFLPNSGTITFDPLETSQQVTVQVAGDNLGEPSETFNVVLSNPNANGTIGDGTGTGTITDDDAPAISISDGGATEGDAGNTPMVFNATLSNPSTETVTVVYVTHGVTATTGQDFAPGSGTITFEPFVTAQPVTVQVIGDTLDEPDETLEVDLINPVNATVADGTGTGTITDDDGAPAISISDVTQTEGSDFTFIVTLSHASTQTVTVDFATAGVTATSGSDFLPNSGTLTFDPLETQQFVTVLVPGDSIEEPSETFNVVLSNPSAGAVLGDSTGTGTILDDDLPPSVSISDVTDAEGDAGPVNYIFNVTLSAPSSQTITVNFATAADTATSGTDFQPNSGTVTFDPLETTQQVTVQVTGDTLDEPNESFNVVLTNPTSGATIADGTGTGTILDDDAPPSISISDVTETEGTGGLTDFVFNVTLSGPSSQTITVSYNTTPGTAGLDDFTFRFGTLTFEPGQTAGQITVPVVADANDEADETFNLVLGSPGQNATIADGTGVGTILDDDDPAAAVADLSVSKTAGPGPFVQGGTATFTITVANDGPDAATNVTVTDILPAGTSLVSATPGSGTCSGTTTVTCNVGTLADEGSATITLIVQLNAPGEITNTATATSAAIDITPAAGAATITVGGAAAGAAIPTLSEWMLMALASALAAIAALKLKR